MLIAVFNTRCCSMGTVPVAGGGESRQGTAVSTLQASSQTETERETSEQAAKKEGTRTC